MLGTMRLYAEEPIAAADAPRVRWLQTIAKRGGTAELMDYTDKCAQDNFDTGGKSAMFESWALQRLANLVVRGLELEERVADLEGSSRR